MKRLLLVWFAALTLAIGGIGTLAPVEDASAHSYIVSVNCRFYTVYAIRHVNVSWGFDRHESVYRSMTYNEYMYYCY